MQASGAAEIQRPGSSDIVMILPESKLDALLDRKSLVEAELSANPDPETFVRLSREFAELAPVTDAIEAYRTTSDELAGIDALIADGATDADMRALAQAEKPALEARR